MSHTWISARNWTRQRTRSLQVCNKSHGGSSAPDRCWQSPKTQYRIQVQGRGPTALSNKSSADQVWRLDSLYSSLASVGVDHG